MFVCATSLRYVAKWRGLRSIEPSSKHSAIKSGEPRHIINEPRALTRNKNLKSRGLPGIATNEVMP